MPHSNINNSIGASFTELHSVDSTNNYAMQQLHQNAAKHGSAYFAYEQFAGKGQRGKQWLTGSGENIILSVVLNTSSLQVSDQFYLSMALALSAHDFFLSHVSQNVFLKWPNDLYWNDRKAGGILIENVIRGMQWQWAVAGFGININQTLFDSSLENPVSLKQITGKTYQANKLAKELCIHLGKRYQQLLMGNTKVLPEEYNRVLYRRNTVVKLKMENVLFDALVKGVNAKGQLVVDAGMEQTFDSGQVEWITS